MPMSGDISLYFHIPFCSKKCPYCHFFVLPDKEQFKSFFVQALLKEWQLRLPQLEGKRVISIYFGGGTPTKLKPDDYQLLLHTIATSLAVAPDCEITLEANPEDVNPSLMKEFRALGINRVSLGVQSFQTQDLCLLGRTHNGDRALRSIIETYEAGIENISIDLMFELPRQTLHTWEANLNILSTLPITHLSLYNLMVEPNTIFFKRKKNLQLELPNDAECLNMLQRAIEALHAMGLRRYEISAFARSGKHSKHNIGYWTARPFLGFGPSAFSYWGGMRFSNVAHFNQYLTCLEHNQFPVDFKECLPFPFYLQELLAIHLRLIEGVDLAAFATCHGPLPDCLKETIDRLIQKQWLVREGDQLKLTPEGQLFYDSVATEII